MPNRHFEFCTSKSRYLLLRRFRLGGIATAVCLTATGLAVLTPQPVHADVSGRTIPTTGGMAVFSGPGKHTDDVIRSAPTIATSASAVDGHDRADICSDENGSLSCASITIVEPTWRITTESIMMLSVVDEKSGFSRTVEVRPAPNQTCLLSREIGHDAKDEKYTLEGTCTLRIQITAPPAQGKPLVH